MASKPVSKPRPQGKSTPSERYEGIYGYPERPGVRRPDLQGVRVG